MFRVNAPSENYYPIRFFTPAFFTFILKAPLMFLRQRPHFNIPSCWVEISLFNIHWLVCRKSSHRYASLNLDFILRRIRQINIRGQTLIGRTLVSVSLLFHCFATPSSNSLSSHFRVTHWDETQNRILKFMRPNHCLVIFVKYRINCKICNSLILFHGICNFSNS